MKKVYFACALAYSTQEYRDEVANLKDLLRKHFEIGDFYGFIPTADPKIIFEHDINQVQNCDMVIAECSYPSTGMGIEIGTALALNKPVIAIAKNDLEVSAMITGNSKIPLIRYHDTQEILEALKVYI